MREKFYFDHQVHKLTLSFVANLWPISLLLKKRSILRRSLSYSRLYPQYKYMTFRYSQSVQEISKNVQTLHILLACIVSYHA